MATFKTTTLNLARVEHWHKIFADLLVMTDGQGSLSQAAFSSFLLGVLMCFETRFCHGGSRNLNLYALQLVRPQSPRALRLRTTEPKNAQYWLTATLTLISWVNDLFMCHDQVGVRFDAFTWTQIVSGHLHEANLIDGLCVLNYLSWHMKRP